MFLQGLIVNRDQTRSGIYFRSFHIFPINYRIANADAYIPEYASPSGVNTPLFVRLQQFLSIVSHDAYRQWNQIERVTDSRVTPTDTALENCRLASDVDSGVSPL